MRFLGLQTGATLLVWVFWATMLPRNASPLDIQLNWMTWALGIVAGWLGSAAAAAVGLLAPRPRVGTAVACLLVPVVGLASGVLFLRATGLEWIYEAGWLGPMLTGWLWFSWFPGDLGGRRLWVGDLGWLLVVTLLLFSVRRGLEEHVTCALTWDPSRQEGWHDTGTRP